MAFAPEHTYFDRGDGSILGRFVEKDHSNLFEFSTTTGADAGFKGFDHKVWVGGNAFRYAKVLKTVAYIVVDEDNDGPVVEKWYIKHHKLYPQPEENTSSLYGNGYAETVPLWVKNG